MHSEFLPEQFGLRYVMAASPKVALANPDGNADTIIRMLGEEALRSAHFIVFPELCITGYSIGDLVLQQTLLSDALQALLKIEDSLKGDGRFVAVGLPVEFKGRIFNCAAVIANGRILGFVPKINIPNYQEFYEKRWYHSGKDFKDEIISFDNRNFFFGTDIIFSHNGIKIGVEICEDLWVPSPPSSRLSRAGAQLILNLSATDDALGKYQYLRSLIASQSGRCRCAYAYASASSGESSTDLVFSGNDIIAFDGRIVASTKRFDKAPICAGAWIDFEQLTSDRRKFSSFFQDENEDIMTYSATEEAHKQTPPPFHDKRPPIFVNPLPFVPKKAHELDSNCEEIVSIQSHGLMQRLSATGCRDLVVGVSGGLDSTLALLVAVRAFNELNLPLSGIHGITMPAAATSSRTYLNALKLMHLLGVDHSEIPIREAVELHFRDIEHDPEKHDVVYENSQARERTQILMDMANKFNGMVLGTGDLSELALGWCTYNGDHMSMYNVNAGVPKTLVRHIVNWVASKAENEELKEVLNDIVATPISPELIPSDGRDEITQKTEDQIGSYELNDFFLYYLLRFGFSPVKIFWLANLAFAPGYSKSQIKDALHKFYKRFFSQQFKRSCMPDGPKVGSVCLSPRGDWRMPSDASVNAWLQQVSDIHI